MPKDNLYINTVIYSRKGGRRKICSFDSEGTISMHQKANLTEFEEILDSFKRPDGGREWRVFFLINEINKLHGHSSALGLAQNYYKNNTRIYNACNQRFSDFIFRSEIYKKSSFECVCNLKSKFWNKYSESPREDKRAEKIIEMLKIGYSYKEILKETR
jgi:hypothetical protein